jgi:hypothetical protein
MKLVYVSALAAALMFAAADFLAAWYVHSISSLLLVLCLGTLITVVGYFRWTSVRWLIAMEVAVGLNLMAYTIYAMKSITWSAFWQWPFASITNFLIFLLGVIIISLLCSLITHEWEHRGQPARRLYTEK